ncbi:nuclear transport factor 2 family protein [Thalassotalea sp. LPB0316]|uniref:nuclear transport factor 2 family protein n=1 Tax=Thalassotalea sp. LPB0316 TaxID=2769490 RepID=UPI001865A694|nr:nuclear transport factor 2 family protein [Thalassotalea sp. LPB0316]QOL26469.1 nuclear transport factor 2 family protein [Thalassotalea sp. LPB0316]
MIEQWHQVVTSRDLTGLADLLADNVVLHSPVIHRKIEGKQMVQMYLTAAFHTFLNETFEYITEAHERREGGEKVVLEFTTQITGIFVNGIDMITFNEAGKIVEFKVMVRPFKALNLINEQMMAMLEKLGMKFS